MVGVVVLGVYHCAKSVSIGVEAETIAGLICDDTGLYNASWNTCGAICHY